MNFYLQHWRLEFDVFSSKPNQWVLMASIPISYEQGVAVGGGLDFR